MNSSLYPSNSFSEQEIKDLSAAMKVGILGTVNPQGLPHLTLITTLMASSPQVVVWGQFMEGSSKKHVPTNPKTGFMVMGLDKNFWRGFADYSHSETSGKDYAYYNNTPLFRYNAYFGVHRVHYMDLIAHTGKHPLPMQRIIPAAVMTMVAKTLSAKPQKTPVLNPWTQAFFNKIDNLKFLGYVNAEGYPVIIPLIQAQALDREHLIYSLGAFGDELAQIPPYTPVAVFGMALSMEDVLVRGTYQGIKRVAGIRCGLVQLDWVYNSMPPTPRQIYPEVVIEAVSEF
ncbi:MAG TPA: hypothetical protein PKK24_00225 [Anaerolineaceae bacterium]|jgi:hypothetical protein|nr:hypothetical protein [Anaerolineaceae bacterium]